MHKHLQKIIVTHVLPSLNYTELSKYQSFQIRYNPKYYTVQCTLHRNKRFLGEIHTKIKPKSNSYNDTLYHRLGLWFCVAYSYT